MDHVENLSEPSPNDDASHSSEFHGRASDTQRHTLKKNVPATERIVTGAAGAALSAWGVRHGGVGGLIGTVAGALLLARSVTGYCPMYSRYGTDEDEREIADRQGWRTAATAHSSITIARPRDVLYRHWRDLSNFGDLMSHVERVDVVDARRSHWVVKAPMGRTIEFDSTLTEDIDGRRIAWQAEESATVRNCGWVEFVDAPDGRGTEVRLFIAYEPPGGELGRVAAHFLHEEPGHQAKDDLRHFKQRMETGEVATPQMRPEPETA